MKKQAKIAKEFILFGGFTLATVCVWVAMQGYYRLNQEYLEKLKEESVELKPIDPNLPTGILEKIKERKEYSLEEAQAVLGQQTSEELEDLINEQPVPSEATPEAVPRQEPAG